MAITYKTGDIFKDSANILVNPVNTQGVMGAGLARKFKLKYPEMYRAYKDMCDSGELHKYGNVHLWAGQSYPFILNFPTKNNWRDPSTLELIEEGLKTTVKYLNFWTRRFSTNNAPRSIAFPKLGSGLGKLDWETDVKPLMEKYLNDVDCDVRIYE